MGPGRPEGMATGWGLLRKLTRRGRHGVRQAGRLWMASEMELGVTAGFGMSGLEPSTTPTTVRSWFFRFPLGQGCGRRWVRTSQVAVFVVLGDLCLGRDQAGWWGARVYRGCGTDGKEKCCLEGEERGGSVSNRCGNCGQVAIGAKTPDFRCGRRVQGEVVATAAFCGCGIRRFPLSTGPPGGSTASPPDVHRVVHRRSRAIVPVAAGTVLSPAPA
jgi:hypothetical protein